MSALKILPVRMVTWDPFPCRLLKTNLEMILQFILDLVILLGTS